MFKLTINYETTIKLKNSKSTLFSIYKRVFFFKIIYFIKNTNKLLNIKLQSNNKILTNKLVLIRSPFHYKNSKTILNSPKQNFKITFFLNIKEICPVFFNKRLVNFLLNLNKNNSIKIKTIKITHNVKFKKKQ